MKPGGRIVLALPDKRFVLDALRFPSSTGDVMEAWGHRHNRHSPARVFDFFSNFSTFGELNTWDKWAHGLSRLGNDLSTSRAWFGAACRNNAYIDVHG